MSIDDLRMAAESKSEPSGLRNCRRHDHLDPAGFPEADLHHGPDWRMVGRHPRIPEFVENIGVAHVCDGDEYLQHVGAHGDSACQISTG